MKRICRIVALVLVFAVVLAVPALAAPTSDDGIISGLLSGWSGSSSPLYYSSSWFLRVVDDLSDISSYSSKVYSLLSNSSYGWNKLATAVLQMDTYMNSTTSGWAKMIADLNYLPTISGYLATMSSSSGSGSSSSGGFSSADSTVLSQIYSHLVNAEGSLSSIDVQLSSFEIPLGYLDDIWVGVAAIRDAVASPEDAAINESQKEEKEAWTSGFGSVDRTSSISDFSGFESGFKSWFSLPDVDISLLFDQVNTGFGGWFSQETADALKAQYGTATLGLDDESDTPLLDENQRQVQEILSGGDGNWLTH